MKYNASEQLKETINTSRMFALAFIVGIIGGIGAIIFRGMIGFVHNFAFNGKFNELFDANHHTSLSVWGWGVIFMPAIGSVFVTFLTQTFAKEAKGHGVPEVMDAIYYREGKIRGVVAIIKSIASSISIGTGGSVGREGPIIQIGAAFGSALGQFAKMNHRQRIVLIAAGAGAGIAATFNSPIGGLAFAMELMLVSLSAVNVALVAISTVTATIISRAFLGVLPSFYVSSLLLPLQFPLHPEIIALCVPFGIIMGFAASLFIHSIYWFEDNFDAVIKNSYLRHIIGMLLLGIMLYLLFRFSGHYYVEGVGYATILDILNGILAHPWFLLLLFFLKLGATGLTLGSGASGGIFSPSLFLGACLGGFFGLIAQHLFPGLAIRPEMFAVAGMAAMVSGSTGAVLTAITMTVEQTRDYADILPIMVSVALTYAVRVRITSESIYTLKLLRRGRMLPQGLEAAISSNTRARHIMNANFDLVKFEELQAWLANQTAKDFTRCAIIDKENEIIGVIRQELGYLRADMDADKLIDPSFSIISANTTWPTILRTMNEEKTSVVLVSKALRSKKADEIIGVITQHEIINFSQEAAKLID